VRIDLHVHSTASDGTQPPAAVVAEAAAAGLDVVALTDHDTAAGWAEAVAAARRAGIELVRGMEISTDHEGRGVHLLAYLPDPTHPGLAEELARVLDGRTARLPRMVAKLQELGIELTVEDVLVRSDGAAASGRPHVADALVDRGVVRSRDEAFDVYLGAGKPAYVPRYAAPLVPMIRTVAEAGGVTVVAHPWGRIGRRRPEEDVFGALQEAGLTGLEVDHQDHSPEDRSRLRAIARSLGLVVTGSSDYHGTGKTDHELGVNTTEPEEYERLLDRAAAASAASGRATPEVVR
jgi:predicted metal-dependent phosphoesterase TrpH